MNRFITKKNLKKALTRLSRDALIVGPVKTHNEMLFKELPSAGGIIFDYENCLNSPKDYVLMNDEPFFTYSLKKGSITKTRQPVGQVVIFGSRACDTRAIGILDQFFSRKFRDPIYCRKRDAMLIITLMCPKIGKNCFCTSTGSGPYLEGGYDIQLVDIGTGFFLESASSKGDIFVRRFSGLLTDVTGDRKKRKEEAVARASTSKRKEFDIKKVYDNLNTSHTKDALWKDLSQRCQSCGGCLLLCPTCSCFYVVDKKRSEKEGARVRSLDTCYYEGLTRMAGGHNPVMPRQAMMQRKFYHKLWQQVNEFGETGCTGCGRCNEICPGNINWLDVIRRIEKVSA